MTKYLRVAFQLKVRVHDGAANAIVRPGKRFNQLGCANSRRPDNRVGREGLVSIDLDRAFEHARDSRGSSHFNSAHIQPLARVRRQFRTDPAQNIRRCFQHDQANLGGVDPAILSRGIAEEKIAHLRDEFDARVAAADHDKREHRAARGGIRGVIRVLAQVDDPLAQLHRLLQRFVIPAVLARSGRIEKFGARAGREDERIVVDRSGIDDHAPVRRVHGAHRFPAKPEFSPAANFTNGLNDVARIGVTRRDLRKKRREEQIILIAEEKNFDVAIAAKHAVEFRDGFQSAEPRPDDHDAFHGNIKFSTFSRTDFSLCAFDLRGCRGCREKTG